MIYLILTASLTAPSEWSANGARREQEYRDAISHTLGHLPDGIQPILVENNGLRTTWLNQILHRGTPVPVVYTSHQALPVHKAVKEMLDVRAAIQEHGIREEDWVIKLTGRYSLRGSELLDKVLRAHTEWDAMVKFYNGVTRQREWGDCILGYYAIRVSALKLFSPYSMDHTVYSPEQVFARYLRVSGLRVHEMDTLGVRCIFSDTGISLDV